MERKDTNLLPSPSAEDWFTYVPLNKKTVCFSKDKQCLNAQITDESYGVGKWIVQIPISGDKAFDFSVQAQSDCSVNDLYVIITVLREDNSMITRDHVRNCTVEDGQIRFYDKINTPQEAASLKLELWIKGCRGTVSWHAPTLVEGNACEQRLVKVAVAYIPPSNHTHTIESNKKDILEALAESAKLKPDIMVLGECMYERGVKGVTFLEAAETVQGEMCTLISQRAREYQAYIIYNFHEADQGEYYNTSVLFDRNGAVVGKYRKTHLTVSELEQGLIPGDAYPVFETDFGKIGMLICWDHYFSATSEKLVQNGAEMIFVSSAGDAAEKCIARAMENGIYLAVCGWNTSENSKKNGWGPGRIVNPKGEILADTSEKGKPAFACIDLNERIRTRWLSLGNAMSENYGVFKYEKM